MKIRIYRMIFPAKKIRSPAGLRSFYKFYKSSKKLTAIFYEKTDKLSGKRCECLKGFLN